MEVLPEDVAVAVVEAAFELEGRMSEAVDVVLVLLDENVGSGKAVVESVLEAPDSD